uniref:AI-2E family transporter n=1 Tax=Roseihalotalea indica TaxID=2867963 RepID=A0AA49JK85_9BACT|nr:AI-2E family transporter [Tunicatimonas sp. TK19036]
MNRIPGYAKYLIVLAAIVLTAYVLIVAKSILSPVLTALILALLLHPLSSLIERARIPRGISSILSIIFVILVISGLSYFFSAQVRSIARDLDTIEARFNEVIDRGFGWMETTFGIEQQEQTTYLKNSLTTVLRNSTSFLTRTLSATAGFFTSFFLAILAMFFFLYYRRFLMAFLYRVFSQEHHDKVGTTVIKIEKVIRSYILGLFTVILIIAVLNTTGLMLLGIQHAMFFGVLAAVLTIIPYIGIFIGSLLPILFALVTKDSLWYPLGVLLIFSGVQFLEGNFITPNIIGGRVSINPFAAILALFFGGMIWGPIGMILSIPVLAICKVIFDTVEPLKPYGFLLGNPPDEFTLEPKKVRLKEIRIVKKNRKERERAKENA